MYRAISPAFSLVLHFPGFPKGRERKPPGKLLVLPYNARFRGGRDPLGNPKPFDFPRKTASCDLRKFRKVQSGGIAPSKNIRRAERFISEMPAGNGRRGGRSTRCGRPPASAVFRTGCRVLRTHSAHVHPAGERRVECEEAAQGGEG